MQTVRFKNEMVRNITIKLGYANAKIYQGGRILVQPDEKAAARGESESLTNSFGLAALRRR